MVLALGCSAALAGTAGKFQPPYNENEVWTPACGQGNGYKQDQYHMQLNPDFTKYHLGEDWNGVCGGSTDLDAPLVAIADGQVTYLDAVDDSTKGKQLYIRYSFPYAKEAGGLVTFDSAYLHLNGFATGITWTSGVPNSGSIVTQGQPVAYIGGTGGWIPHLHWEAQWDLNIPLTTNPYQNPLIKSQALQYRAPSLIVDDRRDSVDYTLPADGFWYTFTMTGNAPSSTTYVEYQGQKKTLKQAIAAGWIDAEGVIFDSAGSWYYYLDVDANFFENGKQYGFKPLLAGVTYHILVPRNNFQKDRARIDMLHAVENDARFVYVKMDVSNPYEYDPNWDPAWDLHKMAFQLADGRIAYVNQITYKANRLIRNTSYYDPDLGQWTAWKWVDWNQLY
ncbi:MAG: hypothetical protein A2937_00175 [Candidatus Yonathbacteria bacterium RIFCSPLOWO2_01_FULL_47_33b]|uniref:Peptidase M23 domain-containing protein n=1 Tax=Candidatus Yonathbacteria bacterium RIFCSPLOWO2_01_FULL_47_33b TaxID=1802727 RepID=A0A1G2SFN3_9BACT|nr:MAG: hypothetical protein A2937_00175 [Candidatus Yonathbacteria bacterium RIFCSPLOWO2_01_FULL_47_33b]